MYVYTYIVASCKTKDGCHSVLCAWWADMHFERQCSAMKYALLCARNQLNVSTIAPTHGTDSSCAASTLMKPQGQTFQEEGEGIALWPVGAQELNLVLSTSTIHQHNMLSSEHASIQLLVISTFSCQNGQSKC